MGDGCDSSRREWAPTVDAGKIQPSGNFVQRQKEPGPRIFAEIGKLLLLVHGIDGNHNKPGLPGGIDRNGKLGNILQIHDNPIAPFKPHVRKGRGKVI